MGDGSEDAEVDAEQKDRKDAAGPGNEARPMSTDGTGEDAYIWHVHWIRELCRFGSQKRCDEGSIED